MQFLTLFDLNNNFFPHYLSIRLINHLIIYFSFLKYFSGCWAENHSELDNQAIRFITLFLLQGKFDYNRLKATALSQTRSLNYARIPHRPKAPAIVVQSRAWGLTSRSTSTLDDHRVHSTERVSRETRPNEISAVNLWPLALGRRSALFISQWRGGRFLIDRGIKDILWLLCKVSPFAPHGYTRRTLFYFTLHNIWCTSMIVNFL